MITNRDVAVIPTEPARARLAPDPLPGWEQVAQNLHVRSLDHVMRVLLRLQARASLAAEPDTRAGLLAEADVLDDAVRAARDLFFARGAPGARHAPTNGDGAGGPDVETALLDTEGTIVWVDRAWDEFCRANGGRPDRAGVGRSYLAQCDAAADTDPTSATVAAAIRAALRGDLPAPTRIMVPCSAPARPRAFDTLISSRRDDRGRVLGATVTLSEVVETRPRRG